jgi:hypothetical protein
MHRHAIEGADVRETKKPNPLPDERSNRQAYERAYRQAHKRPDKRANAIANRRASKRELYLGVLPHRAMHYAM